MDAGLIAGGREGRETRHKVFFTPLNPWSTEEEEVVILRNPDKLSAKQDRSTLKNAAYWIHLGRAQEKGTALFGKRNRKQSSQTAQCQLTVLND